jgi:uncharacterized protein (TIGR02145 family)
MIMKRIPVMVASAALVLGMAGCSDLNDRVDQLETDVKSLQDGIDKLQKAVDAKLTITGVTPTEDGNTVTFSDGSTLTINDGKDGDTLIGSIEVKDGVAYITLADGTSFTFAVSTPLSTLKALVFIPEYNDGKGTINVGGIGRLRFSIVPASAAKALEDGWKNGTITASLSYQFPETRDGDDDEAANYKVRIDSDLAYVDVTEINTNIVKSENIALAFSLTDGVTAVSSEYIQMVREDFVTYGGVKYSARKMKDGKVWMTENLRYLPEGYTPSDDVDNVTAGVYYPLVLNAAGDGMEFSRSEEALETNGYLYQSEVTLGLKVGDIQDEEKAKSLEGAQGICPEGWHIPTAADIMGLVGKAVSYTTNEDAPYYDKVKKNAMLELLNADGFNFQPCGAVIVTNLTATKASLMGYNKSNPGKITSGYYCGSTSTGATKDKSGNITGYQFLAIMPMANNGTANGSKLSHRIGASVRCVMD